MRKATKIMTAIVLAVVMVLSPIAAHAQEQENQQAQPQEQQFEQTIQVATHHATTLMEALSIAGITIAIVDADTGFTWTQGFGYADAPNQVPVDEYTLFQIGSTAKIFTAISIMQLVESGQLDLDEPIVTYLPEFSVLPNPVHGGDYRNITARMLLTHVSGMHEFSGSGESSYTGQDHDFMNRLMSYLSNLHMQNQELNRITYNNTAYTLLGILVARLTGSTNYFNGFVNYTQENIFDPAGMVHSSFEVNSSNRPNISQPHVDATTVIDDFLYVGMASAGSMVSNAVDMARFMHIMLTGGGDIILPETILEMRTPQDFGIPFPNDLPNVPTGLGLMYVAHADGIVTIGHGGTLQHHTEFLLDFDNGIGVFVSGNSIMASAASTPIANAILRAAVEEKTGQTLQPSDPRNLAPVTNAQQLIGFYNSMHLTGTLEIVLCEDGNPQILGIPGLPIPLPLTLAQDGSFESFAGRFWFQEIEGIMFMFIGTNFGHTMVGERVYIEPVSPSFAWAGVYQSHDDNGNVSTMTVNVNENGLAYVEQYGIMFMINEVDANNFHAPGRIRLFGSIFEFGMDGDTAYVRYSGHIYTRVADVPAPEAPAETSTQSQLRFVIGDTAYTINGTTRHMESAPFMDTTYDRTMVPLRVIADIFGAEVDWISQTRTVTIVLGDLNLEISADSPLPGGMGLPHNVGGNIFVPLRYVAYAFGVDVRWDGANQAAYIYLAH